jgi:hypothetical protein
MLSGLFADENAFDRRTLWRIGTWGAAAVGAVITAVLANQSSLGWRRDELAAADVAQQARQIQSLGRASENEARRLSSAIDTLNSDRDRLYARVTVLEQGLDSVTGAVAKQGATQNSATAPPPSAPAPLTAKPAAIAPVAAAPVSMDPSPSSFNQAAAALASGTTGASPPVPSPAASAASPGPMAMASLSERTRSDRARPESPAKPEQPSKSEQPSAGTPSPPPAASPPSASAPMVSPATLPSAGPATAPGSPLIAARSIMAPPDPAASKLAEIPRTEIPRADSPRAENPKAEIPREVPREVLREIPRSVDAGPAPEAASAASAPGKAKETKGADKSKDPGKETTELVPDKVAVQHTDFAVDLGSANSIGGLRALWRGLLKANGALAELRPIIVIRESSSGLGMQLHLAAGPLKDAAAAAKICAGLTEAERSCETTVFDGQRLAVPADGDPALPAAKPLSPAKPGYYRRGSPRHARVEEAPAKPEAAPLPSSTSTSTFSSLFNGKR